MTTLKEFKAKQLEILHELDRVCNLAGVRYYLAYGSCLGAVRHQGMIPWDDDIDVFLPFDEMRKLMVNAHLFKEKYFIQCCDTDPEYNYIKYSLRDSSTSYFSSTDDNQDINHGMYIDIYVLYPYPDNFFAAHKLIIDSFILRILRSQKPPMNHGIIGRISSKIIKFFYRGAFAEKKIRAIEKQLQENGGKHHYASYFGDDITPISCIKFPQEYFDKPQMLWFEDFLAPCPSNPQEICRITYGEKYMEFPPEEQRASRHHVLFMSCEEPYTNFEGKYYFKK